MSEPVLSRKRQDAQDAVETLETFDKHGLPAFVRGVDAEALYFFLALFRTGTLPRAAEQLGISLSSANRMLAKLRTYWDDPLFVISGFLMQPTTAAKRRYDKVLSFMHVLEDLRRDDELDPRTLSRTVRTAMLTLSDAAPKLTVRLGWHERTHADPGSQLIRAQLLALIQKRFGRPAGE